MRAAPPPGEPDVVTRDELDWLLQLAESGRLATCHPVGSELSTLIDRVAHTRVLTAEIRAEAHRLRNRDEKEERLRIAREHPREESMDAPARGDA